jgi:hypothetical protein
VEGRYAGGGVVEKEVEGYESFIGDSGFAVKSRIASIYHEQDSPYIDERFLGGRKMFCIVAMDWLPYTGYKCQLL